MHYVLYSDEDYIINHYLNYLFLMIKEEKIIFDDVFNNNNNKYYVYNKHFYEYHI